MLSGGYFINLLTFHSSFGNQIKVCDLKELIKIVKQILWDNNKHHKNMPYGDALFNNATK